MPHSKKNVMCPTRVTVRPAKFKQNLKRIHLKGKQNRNYDGIKNEAQNTKPHHEDGPCFSEFGHKYDSDFSSKYTLT